jgi:hypothetical protein
VIAQGATIGDGIVAVAAVLPATVAAVAALVVGLRSRTENREQHQAVADHLTTISQNLGIEPTQE